MVKIARTRRLVRTLGRTRSVGSAGHPAVPLFAVALAAATIAPTTAFSASPPADVPADSLLTSSSRTTAKGPGLFASPAGGPADVKLLDHADREIPELRVSDAQLSLGVLRQPASTEPTPTLEPASTSLRFGQAESTWWGVTTGVAFDFEDAYDTNVALSYTYFVVEDVEFNLELGAWYFSQPEDDAAGINPAMVFRWHFVNTGTWTLYADVGIGVLASTDNVPENGTSFNFTPRAGAGFTRLLDDSGTRLQVGVRWAHVSNARIQGESSNPGRDSLMLYAGLIFPF
ncbi:MAG: acyloxyacyl hydrolase [Planctomycetota bacterium]|nr:acyloxyacyl hydrolase [Planctomycetota bacterium]